jgi:hypothetical protein
MRLEGGIVAQDPAEKRVVVSRRRTELPSTPCVMSLTGNVRPTFLGRLGC